MSICSRKDRADAIRFLSIDAVQKANSGHPGMPMGMADIAEVLWHDFLRHNPENPNWPNRDRFVLSNGHGCMLLYALLHLTGYDLTIEDLKHFRQLHSRTPGHPEFGLTPGVETTTGPLGQGLGNAVGMAIAEKHLGAEFNRPDFPIVDHFTYCFVGDGCLMEGISHEVCSLAATLGLGKLIVFYDDNGISIDGDVNGWFTDNTPLRFEAYGWHVISPVDGHNSKAIADAIVKAQAVTDKPTLIHCKTTIGFGSPNKAGKAETHGAALGEKEVIAVRDYLKWPHVPFEIPQTVYESWDHKSAGQQAEQTWSQLFADYQQQYPELAAAWERRLNNHLPHHWQADVDRFLESMNDKKQAIATRKASKQCLDFFAAMLPEMMGGSADLMESNAVDWKDMQVFSPKNPAGRYIHFGVREFGMTAIANGIALHRGLLPFTATFLTFSDYARNAVRLAALMQQRVVFIYTHDSIGLGEDGPTHQPIEHLPSLRIIPNLSVWRPCDSVETVAAWRAALSHQGPTCLLLTRQSVAHQNHTQEQLIDMQRGGYILLDYAEEQLPDLIMIATGSEVDITVKAALELANEGIRVRVISMPSTDVFFQQDAAYRNKVLPPEVAARLAVEAAAPAYWYQVVGSQGAVIGINEFGASAPDKDVFRNFGFTVEHIITQAKAVLDATGGKVAPNTKKFVSGIGK